jgi:hypothetical protein
MECSGLWDHHGCYREFLAALGFLLSTPRIRADLEYLFPIPILEYRIPITKLKFVLCNDFIVPALLAQAVVSLGASIHDTNFRIPNLPIYQPPNLLIYQ